MIVGKAVNMAKMMNIPILGVIENYSYLACPDCGKKIEVFGKSKLDEVAAQYETRSWRVCRSTRILPLRSIAAPLRMSSCLKNFRAL